MSTKEEKLREATEDLKETIREAHETIRTMRLLLREMHEVTDEWAEGVVNVVDAGVERQIKAGLASFKEGIEIATKRSHQNVMDEFDKLKNIMLYGNEAGHGTSVVEDWVHNVVKQEIEAITKGW